MTPRTLHRRETEVACPHCGDVLRVRFHPLTYIRLTRERSYADRLWSTDCGCGRELAVTVGDARRAQ